MTRDDVPPTVVMAGHDCLTALGRGEAEHVGSLRGTPPPPDRVAVSAADEERRLPYHHLHLPDAASRRERLFNVVEKALDRAGMNTELRAECAVLVGSSCSALPETEENWPRDAQGEDFIPLDQPGGHGELPDGLATAFGLHGPRHFIGTACSSSANALLYGQRLIRAGLCRAALVVGVDWYNQLTLRGFEALMLTDLERARPFDSRRGGLVLGEGVAAMVLARADDRPGANWRIHGGATMGDTDSPTHTSPRQVATVINEALATAGVEAGEIMAIKAHGTATGNNDEAEGRGILEVFPETPPVSSLKGAMGHTLGACGAIETATMMACVDASFWPANHGGDQPDPACGIIPNPAPRTVNFFGFGGNNCALVLERRHAT
jgi:3-oxoacyl-(acyl-carrier-protein) synthase